MKKIFFIIVLLVSVAGAFAQTDSTAPYWLNKNIPKFSLLSAKDSSLIGDTSLVKGKPVIFMLFNPECEHCQRQFKLLVSIPQVVQAQVVMCSTEDFGKIAGFAKKFEVFKYPYMSLGKDYKITLGPFFRPRTIPVLAFYNKQGKFVFIKQGEASKKEIVAALKG